MKTLREQKANKCVHFNGTQNKVCEVGIEYPKGPLPCFRDSAVGGECEKCQWRTDEQIDKEIAESDAAFERIGSARRAIIKHLESQNYDKQSGQSGEIECPSCNKRLRFTRSGHNGHIHAACETKGCSAWIE